MAEAGTPRGAEVLMVDYDKKWKETGMLKRLRSALVLGVFVVASRATGAQIIEQVLVNVNGDIITLSEFEDRQVAMLRERPELARVSPNSAQFTKAIQEMAPQVILSAVDELLWMQRAHEHGWQLTDDRVTEIINGIRKQNNLEDEGAFRKALAAEGLTEERLRQQVGRTALIQEAQRVDVYEKINITDEEVRAFYDANKQQFTKQAEITIREILIAVPTSEKGINVAQSDQAKEQAEAARKRLLAGEPFPTVAAEVSASSTKATGGVIGPLKLDDLDSALQKLFGGMAVGDITEVTLTTRGYQIFKLDARTQPAVPAIEDVRNEISRRLGEQKSQGELIKYLEKLRSQAKITWRHDELHKAYDRAVTQRLERLGLSAPVAPPKS